MRIIQTNNSRTIDAFIAKGISMDEFLEALIANTARGHTCWGARITSDNPRDDVVTKVLSFVADKVFYDSNYRTQVFQALVNSNIATTSDIKFLVKNQLIKRPDIVIGTFEYAKKQIVHWINFYKINRLANCRIL